MEWSLEKGIKEVDLEIIDRIPWNIWSYFCDCPKIGMSCLSAISVPKLISRETRKIVDWIYPWHKRLVYKMLFNILWHSVRVPQEKKSFVRHSEVNICALLCIDVLS